MLDQRRRCINVIQKFFIYWDIIIYHCVKYITLRCFLVIHVTFILLAQATNWDSNSRLVVNVDDLKWVAKEKYISCYY